MPRPSRPGRFRWAPALDDDRRAAFDLEAVATLLATFALEEAAGVPVK